MAPAGAQLRHGLPESGDEKIGALAGPSARQSSAGRVLQDLRGGGLGAAWRPRNSLLWAGGGGLPPPPPEILCCGPRAAALPPHAAHKKRLEVLEGHSPSKSPMS